MKHSKYFKFVKKHYCGLSVLLFSALFSTWLMFSTFSYENNMLLIASKAWSDFGSHIPLIRSFSLGSNFPPEYPLFPGEVIRYHFLFYLFVGILEKIGFRIDIALNVLSTIGFTVLLGMIYLFAKKIFKSKSIAALSLLFFLFNGSLSFLYFLKTHTDLISLPKEIITNSTFPSFGPYDGNIISAFWNLNIYTNQRHLALALALSLSAIYLFIRPIFSKKHSQQILPSIILGVLLGLSFFFHLAILLATLLIIFLLAILFEKIRLNGVIAIIIAGIICLPQYLYMQTDALSGYGIQISLGYLSQITTSFPLLNFISYWIANLGFHIILIPLALFLVEKRAKKIFLAFLSLFILANTLQFSPEIAANHKFVNYFMIVGVMYSAFVVIFFWKKNVVGKILAIILVFLCTFSGIIDLFPIINDTKISIPDHIANTDSQWILENTMSDSIILNTTYLNNAASIAGRKIFLGWPYFAWSAGHDTNTRQEEMQAIFKSNDIHMICKKLDANSIDYVFLEQSSPDFQFDNKFWKENFTPEYQNPISGNAIYETKHICADLI